MSTYKYFYICLIALIVSINQCKWVIAQNPNKEEAKSPKEINSLDDDLLDDLSDDSDDAIKNPVKTPKTTEKKPNEGNNQDQELDEELLKDLEPKHDKDDPKASEDDRNRLIDIQKKMITAKSLLIQQKSGIKTQRIQENVIADLDKLIKKVRQQSTNSSRIVSNKKNSAKSPDKNKKTDKGNPKLDNGNPNNLQAKDSTTNSEKNLTNLKKMGNRKSLLKEYWGHLPLHLRQQMPQNPNGQFLPKYELEIEEYFRRLLELQSKKQY